MQNQFMAVTVPIGIAIIMATIALADLILVESCALRSELREAARHRAELRDRMGRIEGTLDILRDFFIRSGRDTAG